MNNCYHIEKINELLIKVLEFYADYENYRSDKIKLDGGAQANYAIKTAKTIYNEHEKANNEYEELINKLDDDESFKKNLLKTINEIKNI